MKKRLRISMDRISDSDSEDAGSIPAGVTTTETKPLNSKGLAVFAFGAYPFCSPNANSVVRDSGVLKKRKFSPPRSGLTHSLSNRSIK
jgi:hypothetical protein